MSRVLVVGGGLAGCAAAVAAAREGTEVTLAWKAPGATALHTGAFAFDGDLGALPPAHPLAGLELDALQLGSALDAALDAFAVGLRQSGLELTGAWRAAGSYADLHGRPRSASLVPTSVAPGELIALRGRRVAVVGFDRVSEYDAESTAEALRELAGVDAFAHHVHEPDLPAGASVTDLAGRRAPATGRVRAEAIAFPPGLRDLPPAGFELLPLSGSVFGWRLHSALHAWARSAGARVVRMRVHGLAGERGHIEAALDGERRLDADAFVLATGRFIGGGLRQRRHLVASGSKVERLIDEPLLGLTTVYEGRPVRGNPRLPHLEYLDPEPAFLSGVGVDRQLRPDGYTNLFAAGAVLAGWDEAGSGGSGVPLLTGWLAGNYAARCAMG